jgi:hypothetical protein
MELGKNINPGMAQQANCEEYSYDLSKGGVILPNSGNKNKFYLIHRAYDDTGKTVDRLYYSEVDLSFNQGLGKVIKKNVPLLKQRQYRSQFDITKHSNGIDYWIFTYNFNSDTIFRFLVNSNEILGPLIQYFPIPREKYDQRANSTISADGRFAVRIDPVKGLFIMDIDRETGLFSNLRQYPYWSSVDSSPVTSVSFSPNGKLLYVSSLLRLWQFDIESSDFEKSRILIDTFDLFEDPYYTTFYLMQLAPNGKIYMNCTNGVKYLHTIHKPNERGKACEFKQHDLILPAQNAFTMPYFPNYRLGPITDLFNESKLNNSNVYPNPVKDKLFISNNYYNDLYYEIYNLIGNKLLSGTVENYIDVESLVNGLYLLKLKYKGEKFQIIKIDKMQ